MPENQHFAFDLNEETNWKDSDGYQKKADSLQFGAVPPSAYFLQPRLASEFLQFASY